MSNDPRRAIKHVLTRWLRRLLIAAIATAAAPAFAVNHYIVLFDGSGSVKDQHRKRDNLWQGKTGDNPTMAHILQRFVDKAVKEMPPGFPRFDPDAGDILSFLIFHTDIHHPSYRPERLFLTNESLLQAPSLPRESDYLDFDASARTGTRGDTIELKDVFKGHSPLIAATGASLPFLADAFRRADKPYGAATEPVDNIYIIRITDGDYNTEASGADEHNVIADTAAKFRKKQGLAASGVDDGFADHRELNKRINGVFDIGATSVDCAFPTHKIPDRFDRPFDCSEGAYEQVKGWGKGFLISYLSVTPKVTAVGLARTEKTRLELDSVYKTTDASGHGTIRLIGTNAIFANSFEDPGGRYRLFPEDLEWCSSGKQCSDDESKWQPCDLPGRDTGVVACNGGGPDIDFPESEVPETLTYRARYLMDFTERPDQPPLYPYVRRLPWVGLPTVTVAVAPIKETFYEFLRYPESTALSWLNPKHLLPTRMQEFPEPKIDAETLGKLAPAWTDELTTLAEAWQTEPGIVTPRMLAQVSQGKKNQIEFTSRLAYFLLLAVPTGFWFAWPRRKLEAEVKPLTEDNLVLDFNDRTHERTVLVAMVQIRNPRRNPTYTAGFKCIAAGLRTLPPSAVANADGKALVFTKPAREGAPLGLGGPHQHRHEERHPASGRELPVFFDPTEIRDLDQIAGVADAVFALPAEVDLDADRAGKETLPLGCRVRILPEVGRLAETCKDIELDADGHKYRRIGYRAGERAEQLCTYGLRSSARHRYSRPVKGELKVLVHDLGGRPLAAAVQLITEDQPLDRVDFYLRYQDSQDMRVVVDFTRLANPIDQDTYRVSILRRQVDDGTGAEEGVAKGIDLRPLIPSPPAPHLSPVAPAAPLLAPPAIGAGQALSRQERGFCDTLGAEGGDQDQGATDDQAPGVWETLDEWNLIVERSTERTEVSMLVLENEQHHSDRLNAARKRLDTPFPIGTETHPRPVMRQTQADLNRARLFSVRLANACRNGLGHADWHARLEVEDRRGLQFPAEALRLVDRRGRPLANGTLRDSPDIAARELDLGVELDLGQVVFTQRDLVLEIGVTVAWTLIRRNQGTRMHRSGSRPAPGSSAIFATSRRAMCSPSTSAPRRWPSPMPPAPAASSCCP